MNSYTEFIIENNVLIFDSFLPVISIFVKTYSKLENVEMTIQGNIVMSYNEYIINNYMIKKNKHWSTNHELALEDTLKDIKVVKGVRNMIKTYCIPKYKKEYFYWLSFDYDNNYYNDKLIYSRINTKNINITLKGHNNKIVNGSIYVKQYNELNIKDGLCAPKYCM
jgi:hypothetical protein